MIYKYIDLKDSFLKLKTAKKEQIWLSSPQKFNDPFDCSFPIKSSFSEDEFYDLACKMNEIGKKKPPIRNQISKFSAEELNNKGADMLKVFLNSMNTWGICSSSKNWDSILMWSHYADHHQGLCLGYDDSTYKHRLEPFAKPLKQG